MNDALAFAILPLLIAVTVWRMKLFTRRWGRLYVNPKTVVFPNVCPMCLSPNASAAVHERSQMSLWGWRFYAQTFTGRSWKGSVPHCVQCRTILIRDEIIGWVVGAVVVITVFVVSPPSPAEEVSLGLLAAYFVAGYAVYLVFHTFDRAIVLGAVKRDGMCVLIRRQEYLQHMATANPGVGAALGASQPVTGTERTTP